MKVSADPDAFLVTHALGSCIGLTIYDPVVKVGGMIHYMLPSSRIDPQRARENPLMFADTGIPLLFKAAYKLGAEKSRIIVKIAGGANLLDSKGVFQIGKRNFMAARKILWANQVLIRKEDTGGTVSRGLKLVLSSGEVLVKTPGQSEVELA
jgi:chemotaxis protein CheD